MHHVIDVTHQPRQVFQSMLKFHAFFAQLLPGMEFPEEGAVPVHPQDAQPNGTHMPDKEEAPGSHQAFTAPLVGSQLAPREEPSVVPAQAGAVRPACWGSTIEEKAFLEDEVRAFFSNQGMQFQASRLGFLLRCLP
jgi:hypothetical protein